MGVSIGTVIALIKAFCKGGGGGGGAVDDVQVDGVSVVSGGVANIPAMSGDTMGVAKLGDNNGLYGLTANVVGYNGVLMIAGADDSHIKAGASARRPIVTQKQHVSTFYGLAKVAGADMSNISSITVGVYPELQKSAISEMLNAPETVSGSTPSITAKPGVRYICGECTTLDITVPSSGCIDVTFESGSTPTVLTITPPTGMTMKWANGFDPTSLDANTTYEINILDGCYGVVGKWT